MLLLGAVTIAAVTEHIDGEDGMKGSAIVESPSLSRWRTLGTPDPPGPGEQVTQPPQLDLLPDYAIHADLFEAGVLAPTPAPAPVVTSTATVEPTVEAAATPVLPAVPGGCPAVIIQVFGATAPAACAVAWCESNWQAGATGAAGEMGYFQVHPRWHADATYDPYGNALAAYRISSGGYDWSAWTCKPW